MILKMNPMKMKKIFVFFIYICFHFSLSATTYYISPSGLDTQNGLTENTAWGTFTHSYSVLEPGDTLIILDGTYNQKLQPLISGTAGNPITFKAKNFGKAVLAPTDANGGETLAVKSWPTVVGYLTFEGLIIRGVGDQSAITINTLDDNAIESAMTHHIVLRCIGAFGSGNGTNNVVINIGNGACDTLLEDVFAYGFGRKALQVFGSVRITVRRAVLRYDYWDGFAYKPNDPRVAFSGYNTQDSIFENIIVLDSAPTPPGRSADRAALVASGNQTPSPISGSKRNKYLGLIALDNYGNGLEINGGSGGPNVDLVFKDILIWNSQYYGVNIQNNDNGSKLSFLTLGKMGLTGFRIDQNPSSGPISNEEITNVVSFNNGGYGFYYDSNMVSLFVNNSAVGNVSGPVIEANYAPTLNYLVKPTVVPGYERGATIIYRYVDGNLTTTPLWPWPYEDLIKQHMCNPADLQTVHRVASNGAGWEPKWAASGKSLTQYIWEYLGSPIPSEIYGNTSDLSPPNLHSVSMNSSGNQN